MSVEVVVKLPPELGKGMVCDDVDHLARILEYQSKKYDVYGVILIGDKDESSICKS
jgi:hypothetical protein